MYPKEKNYWLLGFARQLWWAAFGVKKKFPKVFEAAILGIPLQKANELVERIKLTPSLRWDIGNYTLKVGE